LDPQAAAYTLKHFVLAALEKDFMWFAVPPKFQWMKPSAVQVMLKISLQPHQEHGTVGLTPVSDSAARIGFKLPLRAAFCGVSQLCANLNSHQYIAAICVFYCAF